MSTDSSPTYEEGERQPGRSPQAVSSIPYDDSSNVDYSGKAAPASPENEPSSPEAPASPDNGPISPDVIFDDHISPDDLLPSQMYTGTPVSTQRSESHVYSQNMETPAVDKDEASTSNIITEHSQEIEYDRDPTERDSEDELVIRKKNLIDSDDDDNDDNTNTSPTKRRVHVSSDDESDSDKEERSKKKNKLLGSDLSGESDNDNRGEEVGELMANIFGDDSDDDGEGSNSEIRKDEKPSDEKIINEDQDDYPERDRVEPDGGWDFDEMMRRKKAERKKQRKRRGDGIDIINDDDGRIAAMIELMKNATKEDRLANQERKPALKKRKLLSEVKMMLLRSDMFEALIENGMMSAVSDWLSPLPDKSLPALEIRTELLKLLQEFARLDQGVLKQSGLGKAVMMLYKHPKETKQNKELASKLIRAWSRPIFQLDTDFRAVTREERESRDQERVPEIKRRRLSSELGSSFSRSNDFMLKSDESFSDSRDEGSKSRSKKKEVTLKPGDKGYIGRARVPRPSTRDYVVRPKSLIEGDFKGERKGRAYDRLNKAQREFNERTKKIKTKRAVQVSLEGRNLAI